MLNRKVRKKRVLNIIIKSHIDTASPIGSRLVARRLGLSSATIRNIMADLEEEGFISQPYTSAGRVPTDKAYRLYVNSIMHRKTPRTEEKDAITKLYFSSIKEIRDPAEYTSRVISALTHYTGFSISPEHRFYLDGAYHMLEQPEFKDVERMRLILQILEEKDKMTRIMDSYFREEDISVHIGAENIFEDFKSCSVITASYRIKRGTTGGLGLIGPTRMQYDRVIPTVRFLSTAASRLLEEIYG